MCLHLMDTLNTFIFTKRTQKNIHAKVLYAFEYAYLLHIQYITWSGALSWKWRESVDFSLSCNKSASECLCSHPTLQSFPWGLYAFYKYLVCLHAPLESTAKPVWCFHYLHMIHLCKHTHNYFLSLTKRYNSKADCRLVIVTPLFLHN